MWDKSTYNFMEFVREKCEMIVEAEELAADMPEGTLIVHKKKEKDQMYWQKIVNGKKKSIFLNSIKDAELIQKLTLKKNTATFRKNASKWKKILPSFKCAVKQALSEYKPLAMPDDKIYPSEKAGFLDEWQEKTLRGEYVRSRAEALIADRLFYMNIPYRYEMALNINGITIHPDFTIINPLNGQYVYVEFLGLDTPEYNESWQRKYNLYKSAGLHHAGHLIVITNQQRKDADLIFTKAFTIERYNEVLEILGLAL